MASRRPRGSPVLVVFWFSLSCFPGILGNLLKTSLQVSWSPEGPEAYRFETAADEKSPNDLFELVWGSFKELFQQMRYFVCLGFQA